MAQQKRKKTDWVAPSFDIETPSATIANGNNNVSTNNDSTTTTSDTTIDLSLSNKRFCSATVSLPKLLQACEPKKSADLVVSKQKQKELSEWLKNECPVGRASAAVVFGPAGCAKSTAVKIIAKELGFGVTEWLNPIDQVNENNWIVKQSDKFEDFLTKASRFKSLIAENSRNLLLVKDVPNIYMDGRLSFSGALEKYFEYGRSPVIFICTEMDNSRMVNNLFPKDGHEGLSQQVKMINFKAATTLALTKAVKRMATILNAKASQLLNVSQSIINEVLSNESGDVRNAQLNIIFASLKLPKNIVIKEREGREENLGLFHGVGRVTNPKRKEVDGKMRFTHDPDQVATAFQSHGSKFYHFIFENYLNTMGSMNGAMMASEVLSLTDNFAKEWRDIGLTKLMTSYCVRGLMLANEKPVTGWNPVKKPHRIEGIKRRDVSDAEIKHYESLIKPNRRDQVANVTIPVDDVEEQMIIE